MTSARTSFARSAAAESVVKYGLPVPPAKMTHALLLEVTNRPAPNERLGDRAHLERRHDAGVDLPLLEGVLQRQGVDDGREHSHVVARDAVDALRRRRDAPDDVSAADDDGNLDAEARDFRDLVGHARDHCRLDAEELAAEERLPGELQQDPAVAGFHVSYLVSAATSAAKSPPFFSMPSPTLKRTKRTTDASAPPRSAMTWDTFLLSSLANG